MVATTYKKILVPLDGSDLAAQALAHAEMLAAQLEAQLILFRVVPEVIGPVELTHLPADRPQNQRTGLDLQLREQDEKQRQLIEGAEHTLYTLAEMLRHHGLAVETEVDMGDPARRIIHYAHDHRIDLIVMSTHGRTGLARFVYGSVAEKVLHTAECPVLLVRAIWSRPAPPVTNGP